MGYASPPTILETTVRGHALTFWLPLCAASVALEPNCQLGTLRSGSGGTGVAT